jgi:hypothetical protein
MLNKNIKEKSISNLKEENKNLLNQIAEKDNILYLKDKKLE